MAIATRISETSAEVAVAGVKLEEVDVAVRWTGVPKPYRCTGSGNPYAGVVVLGFRLSKCGFVARLTGGSVRRLILIFRIFIDVELTRSGTALSFGKYFVE